MEKPSKETILKHVKKLEAVANRRKGSKKGLLPPYQWLNDNGFFRSYEIMRAVPSAFKHIKREFARG